MQELFCIPCKLASILTHQARCLLSTYHVQVLLQAPERQHCRRPRSAPRGADISEGATNKCNALLLSEDETDDESDGVGAEREAL